MKLLNRLLAFVPATAFLTFAAPSMASSDSAWAAFNGQVTRACVVASGIRNSRPSKIIAFDDAVGRVAMLVSDRTRGSSVSKLCLYDKRTRKASVDDAEMWSAPPQR
ncbi:hypothetical protein [Novosphingobium sp. P6W]|uniref:hypothetical protein n=1 Tax=Novosphingobium sp. P6W TaxID=1609758 RepID=UPI0005C7247D|nr:hypothetical protein [Novosphingobium sp. P6W]